MITIILQIITYLLLIYFFPYFGLNLLFLILIYYFFNKADNKIKQIYYIYGILIFNYINILLYGSGLSSYGGPTGLGSLGLSEQDLFVPIAIILFIIIFFWKKSIFNFLNKIYLFFYKGKKYSSLIFFLISILFVFDILTIGKYLDINKRFSENVLLGYEKKDLNVCFIPRGNGKHWCLSKSIDKYIEEAIKSKKNGIDEYLKKEVCGKLKGRDEFYSSYTSYESCLDQVNKKLFDTDFSEKVLNKYNLETISLEKLLKLKLDILKKCDKYFYTNGGKKYCEKELEFIFKEKISKYGLNFTNNIKLKNINDLNVGKIINIIKKNCFKNELCIKNSKLNIYYKLENKIGINLLNDINGKDINILEQKLNIIYKNIKKICIFGENDCINNNTRKIFNNYLYNYIIDYYIPKRLKDYNIKKLFYKDNYKLFYNQVLLPECKKLENPYNEVKYCGFLYNKIIKLKYKFK